ncbi:MAG: sugar transferase [Planctomycetota bacterium]
MKRMRNWTERTSGLVFLVLLDSLALFDAFALGYLCRFQWSSTPSWLPNGWIGDFAPPAPGEYLKAWGLTIYLVLLLFHAYGLYNRDRLREPIDSVPPVLRAGSAALLLMLASSYFYRGFSYSRLAVLYSCGFALLLVGLFRATFESYRKNLKRCAASTLPIVLVGSRDIPQFLAQRIEEDPCHGYRIVGIVDDVEITSDNFLGLPRGRFEDLPALIDRTGAREVLIGHPAVGHHQLLQLIEACEARDVCIRMVPATYDLLIDLSDLAEVGGIPLVMVNERRHRPLYGAAKRVLDVVGALALLSIAVPILVIAAICIRLDSRGPACFRQNRVGRDGKTFRIWKLRTMVVDAEAQLKGLVDLDGLAEPVFKLERDPRVTRVGRWLRRTSIDELPQLLNVLRGEMSLVGPRPEESQIVARYDVWERRRLKLKPGLTGLQQIHCRGSNSLKQRVRWDILYLRKQSLLLDLWILLRTVVAVVHGRGAR